MAIAPATMPFDTERITTSELAGQTTVTTINMPAFRLPTALGSTRKAYTTPTRVAGSANKYGLPVGKPLICLVAGVRNWS